MLPPVLEAVLMAFLPCLSGGVIAGITVGISSTARYAADVSEEIDFGILVVGGISSIGFSWSVAFQTKIPNHYPEYIQEVFAGFWTVTVIATATVALIGLATVVDKSQSIIRKPR